MHPTVTERRRSVCVGERESDVSLCVCVNMLFAGSSQCGVDQKEACAVLVPSQRTSHLVAGSASPVDVTRMARGGQRGQEQIETDRERDSVCGFVYVCRFAVQIIRVKTLKTIKRSVKEYVEYFLKQGE